MANHHARAAFVTMLQSDESRVTVLFVQVRPVTRQNVSMKVDFHARLILVFSSRDYGDKTCAVVQVGVRA
jgi:hypothetical protein